MNDLDGTVALVTGGAGGLGSAVARRLHARGAGVTIFDFAQEPAEALADELGDGSVAVDRKSTRLNSSHSGESRMPSSA